jgi:hypothetical protein
MKKKLYFLILILIFIVFDIRNCDEIIIYHRIYFIFDVINLLNLLFCAINLEKVLLIFIKYMNIWIYGYKY